jgi:uncharacterized protein
MAGRRSRVPFEVSNPSIVDGCAFHEWPSSAALLKYMDPAWEDLVSPRSASFAVNLHGQRPVHDPFLGPTPFLEPSLRTAEGPGAAGAGTPLGSSIPGSDYRAFEHDVLGQDGIDHVVLGYDVGLPSTAFVHRYFARDVVRAANDWTVEEWLRRDERLYAMLLVSTAVPQEAAAEIRRVGVNERMVAVALGCNGLSCPFGEPAYLPIFEAADELGLPIVIQVGSDNAADQPAPPLANGFPSTYSELRAHAPHTHWSHASSLITEGVFNRFPKLKVLLMGGGAAWIAPWLWKMNYWYKMTQAAYPWIDRLPSEYLVDHIRVSTHSLEKPPQPERLAQALRVIADIDHVLLYASGYPDASWESAAEIAQRLPAEWHGRVFHTNAMEFFRWPDRVVSTTADAHVPEPVGGF